MQRVIIGLVLAIQAILLQTPPLLELKRFEVIRVNPDDLRRLPGSMGSIFADPVPDGQPVADLEAAKRVGFTPRLLNGQMPKRLFVTDAVNAEVKIGVQALTQALRD